MYPMRDLLLEQESERIYEYGDKVKLVSIIYAVIRLKKCCVIGMIRWKKCN